MAVPLTALIEYLDDLLDARSFEDYGPNGLQVPGSDTVETVITGVSAHGELLDAAAARSADLVLVHHGLFWKGQPLEVTPLLHTRLKKLFDAEMALAAYHLPLDAHLEHGNNALIARALELVDITRLGDLGVSGELPAPCDLEAFATRVERVTNQPPLLISGGDRHVRRVGIVSGAGTDYISDALQAGCDTFITGEASERAYGLARDCAIHYLAAGHHATETFGIRRLGDLLATEFGVQHHFIDVRNPI